MEIFILKIIIPKYLNIVNNNKFGSLALVNKKLEIRSEMNNLAF